jgi:hypothetical protein
MGAKRRAKAKAKPKSIRSKAAGAARRAKTGSSKLKRKATKVVSNVGRAAKVTRDVAGTVADVADAIIKPKGRSGKKRDNS